MSRGQGRRALLVVVVTTALVITPLILSGIFLGYYVGDAVGYPKSFLAIAFSTAGFIVGLAILFRVIETVVTRTEATKS